MVLPSVYAIYKKILHTFQARILLNAAKLVIFPTVQLR